MAWLQTGILPYLMLVSVAARTVWICFCSMEPAPTLRVTWHPPSMRLLREVNLLRILGFPPSFSRSILLVKEGWKGMFLSSNSQSGVLILEASAWGVCKCRFGPLQPHWISNWGWGLTICVWFNKPSNWWWCTSSLRISLLEHLECSPLYFWNRTWYLVDYPSIFVEQYSWTCDPIEIKLFYETNYILF